MQINNNDDKLYAEVIRSILKTNTLQGYIHKIFDSKMDYCYNSLESIFCFNLSQVVRCNFEYSKTIETNSIQFLIHKSGICILNSENNSEVIKQIIDLFGFRKTDDFIEKRFFQK